jgi:hypothetical protein
VRAAAFAPAKVNLTLPVTGRRDNGYHPAGTRAGDKARSDGRQRDAALAVPGDRAQQPIKPDLNSHFSRNYIHQ